MQAGKPRGRAARAASAPTGRARHVSSRTGFQDGRRPLSKNATERTPPVPTITAHAAFPAKLLREAKRLGRRYQATGRPVRRPPPRARAASADETFATSAAAGRGFAAKAV